MSVGGSRHAIDGVVARFFSRIAGVWVRGWPVLVVPQSFVAPARTTMTGWFGGAAQMRMTDVAMVPMSVVQVMVVVSAKVA